MAEQNKKIFGIDLGTTYSCIAYVDAAGKATVVPNMDGELITPSVVLFENSINCVVGREAKNSAIAQHDQVVEMVKRRMGTKWRFEYGGQEFSPEEISSYILRKVVSDASTLLGEPITEAVITCPAYFGFGEREATRLAGELAGLKVAAVLNEPTAAAIDYGVQNVSDQAVLVYDLGGGTFDVTLMEIRGSDIRVLDTDGDPDLGGRDWDELIVEYVAREWMRETGSSESPLDSDEASQDLWIKAENAKKALTTRTETRISLGYIGQQATVTLTREKFDELTEPKLERTIQLTRQLLGRVGDVRFDRILLVGGSTLMPQVAERLGREFPGVEAKPHDPHLAVAKGAAFYGQQHLLGQQVREEIAKVRGVAPEQVNLETVTPSEKKQAAEKVGAKMGMLPSAVLEETNKKIINVLSHSFGVLAIDTERVPHQSFISNLLISGEELPANRQETYGTYQDNQASVKVECFENTSRKASLYDVDRVTKEGEAKKLGEAILKLPNRLPAGSPIEVTFTMNEQGLLHIKGRDPSTNTEIEANIQTSEGLSEQERKMAELRSQGIMVV